MYYESEMQMVRARLDAQRDEIEHRHAASLRRQKRSPASVLFMFLLGALVLGYVREMLGH